MIAVGGLPDLGRCRVVAVLNVTPDSFSDGGRYADPDRAVRHGLALVAAGADVVDVGGESTRPGAERTGAGEELRRVEPVVAALVAAGATVSIDTTRASVARAALAAGASIVNDVSGGLADPDLLDVVAGSGAVYVAMHSRGPSRDMAGRAAYRDVVSEVVGELADRLAAVQRAGVEPDRVVLDPGLGFAKTAAHNWTLLAHLDALAGLGRPVLVGASRKSFLGSLPGAPGAPRPPGQRDGATAAVTALAAAAGAWGVRVHEVTASLDAVRVAAALRAAR